MNVNEKTFGWKKAYKSPFAFVLFAVILLLIVIVNIEKEIPERKPHYIEPPETDIYIGFTDLKKPRYLPIYTGEERYAVRTKRSCLWSFVGLWDKCREAAYLHTLVIAKNPRAENLLDPEGENFYIRAGTNRHVAAMFNFSSDSSPSSSSKCRQEGDNVLLCAVSEHLTKNSVDNINEIKFYQPIGSVKLKFSEVKSRMKIFAEIINMQKLSYNPAKQNCNTVASQFIKYIGLDSEKILETPRYSDGPVVFPGWELPNGYILSSTQALY